MDARDESHVLAVGPALLDVLVHKTRVSDQQRASKPCNPYTPIKHDHINDTANQCWRHTPYMVPSRSHAVLAGVKTGLAWLDGRLRSIVPGDRQGRVPTEKEMRGAAKIGSEVQHGRDS